jgi:iron complex outermembrane receptor protein
MIVLPLFAQETDTVPPAEQITPAVIDSTTVTEIVVTATKVRPKPGSAANGYRYNTAHIGPLGNLALKDIPFSVSVTSASSIENREAHILTDAVQLNPTVFVIQQPCTDGRGQSEMNIRGFDPFYLQDGLIMRATLPIAPENVDRMEVFNGLSGFLYGFGSPGGTVNFISKQPSSEADANFSLGQYNGGINYLRGDLGGPLVKSDKLNCRINAYTENGGSYTDQSSQRRARVSGALNSRICKNTVLTANASYQEMQLKGQQASFIVDPAKGIQVPGASQFNPSMLYGQPWTSVRGTQEKFGCGVESALTSFLSLRGAYSYTDLRRKNNGVSATLIDNAGKFRATYSDGAPQRTFEHSAYALADAKFVTGPVSHAATLGWMHNSSVQRNNPVSIRNILLDTFSVAHPEYYAMPDTVSLTDATQRLRPVYNSFLVGDMMSYKMFSLLAGVNLAQYNTKNHNTATGVVTNSFRQSKPTPSVALLFKPLPAVSTYASYMQGLAPGGMTTTSYAKNVNDVLSPGVSDQYEIGAKATAGAVDLTAAAFTINKLNEFLDPRDSVYKQDGRQIHRGFEVSAQGHVLNGLIVGGGGTLLDAYVSKAATADFENKVPQNVPEKIARVYLEYAVPAMPGLSLSSSASYSGIRWVDTKNTAYIPTVWLFDGGVRYQPPVSRLSVNMRVSNILNSTYWAAYKPAGTVGLVLGAPRLLSMSIRYDL